MSSEWHEYYRRIAVWRTARDSERLALADIFRAAGDSKETDTERSFALFTRGRDEARRLNEPWWVLFFENWRLNSLASDAEDFARALPLAVELMVRFNAADGRAHECRESVLENVLYTYTSIDPLGYREEIERSIAYLDGEIARGPNSARLVLYGRWMYYLSATERWEDAYDIALRSLGLGDQSRDSGLRTWFGAWALFELCRICRGLGRLDELAGHAEHMEELSAKHADLRRTLADAWLWRAFTQRAKGDERDGSHCFHRGMRVLAELELRDSICAEPLAAYQEACGDLKAAVGVRDREIAEVTKKGTLHRICQAHVERCRLLARAGELAPADLVAARLTASKLRVPGRFLEKLERIARNECAEG